MVIETMGYGIFVRMCVSMKVIPRLYRVSGSSITQKARILIMFSGILILTLYICVYELLLLPTYYKPSISFESVPFVSHPY